VLRAWLLAEGYRPEDTDRLIATRILVPAITGPSSPDADRFLD